MTTSADITRPYINYSKAFSRHMASAMDSRRLDVLVLTPQDYVGILQDRSRHDPVLAADLRAILAQGSLGKYWTDVVSPNTSRPWTVPAGLAANDIYLIAKTLAALRISGASSYVKRGPKGTYIIIKGYPGFRNNLLQGTRFLASHPRMIQMGLGIRGMQGAAKGGFILGLVVSVAVETLDFIFNDQKTMHDLVGGIGVEAVKAGLATMMGIGVGAAVASLISIAILPMAAMAVTVLIAGMGFNYIDRNWEIKGSVIKALRMQTDGVEQGIYRINTSSSSWKNFSENEGREILGYSESSEIICRVRRMY